MTVTATNREYGMASIVRMAEATCANMLGASLVSSSSSPSVDVVMLGSILGGVAVFKNSSRLQDSPTILKVSVVAISLFLVFATSFSSEISLQEREIHVDQSSLGQLLVGVAIGVLSSALMSKVLRTNGHPFTYGAILAGATVQAIHDTQVLQAFMGVQRREDLLN